MTGLWRRLLTRGTDLYLWLEWSGVWTIETHYEPMFVFIALPYRSADPKLQERQALMDGFYRSLQGDGLPKVSCREDWTVLCKFLYQARKLCPVPGSMVSPVLPRLAGETILRKEGHQ